MLERKREIRNILFTLIRKWYALKLTKMKDMCQSLFVIHIKYISKSNLLLKLLINYTFYEI